MTIELYKNSLITLQDADSYFDERYGSQSWTELEDSEKEEVLCTASKKISRFDFVGEPLEKNQPLAFPRDFDMPQDIKDAVCEEAIALVQNTDNVHLQNLENNITSISLGAGSVSYSTGALSSEAKLLRSSTAIYLVQKWIKKGYFI